jgi:hypothetical protein
MTKHIKVTSESRTNKRGHYTHSVAGIRISGRWLEKAGFLIGELTRVTVADGIIQIIKANTVKEGGNNEQ